MRIAFAGTPAFAAAALSALIDAGHEVCLVLTQPDRPSGRGMKLKPSAVKEGAQHSRPDADFAFRKASSGRGRRSARRT